MTSVPTSSNPNQNHPNVPKSITTAHTLWLQATATKKTRSGSPSQRGQRDIMTRDPRCNSSSYDATINQPRHTYIHHHHPYTTISSHRNNKPSYFSPNKLGKSDITSQDPRCNNSVSNVKIHDRRNSYRSDNNWHYCKWNFWCSHSSCKCGNHQSQDSFQPFDMHDKETVEDGWSVGKRKLTPNYPGA